MLWRVQMKCKVYLCLASVARCCARVQSPPEAAEYLASSHVHREVCSHAVQLLTSGIHNLQGTRARGVRQRTPAWTDRVLWKFASPELQQCNSGTEGPIKQLLYSSVNSMTFSDHRAVHALFRLQVCPILKDFPPMHVCCRLGCKD